VSGARQSYDGPALDGSVQYITEAPAWQGDGETVDVVGDRDNHGLETTEKVPVPSDEPERPDIDGQTALDDWGWSPTDTATSIPTDRTASHGGTARTGSSTGFGQHCTTSGHGPTPAARACRSRTYS